MAGCQLCVSCPECGDRLIHQGNRGHKESSSNYGQYIFESQPHEFYYMDVDGAFYKRDSRILRIIEQKKHGQPIKPSQDTILKLIDNEIQKLIESGEVCHMSGVFIVRGEYPFL